MNLNEERLDSIQTEGFNLDSKKYQVVENELESNTDLSDFQKTRLGRDALVGEVFVDLVEGAGKSYFNAHLYRPNLYGLG